MYHGINCLCTNILCPIIFLIIKENFNNKITTCLSSFIIVCVRVSELVFSGFAASTFDDVIFTRLNYAFTTRQQGSEADFGPRFYFILIQPVTRMPFAFLCVSFSDGVWKGKSCGVSGHGLLLRSGGTEAQSRFEKHPMCCGSIQDMERRRVSLWGEDIWTGWVL